MKKFQLFKLGLLITVLLGASTVFSQTTINVPGDYATIQAAITAASDGDIIQIAPGTYTEALTVGKTLTFIGSGPASLPTTIITSTASRVIQLTVTGKSFTFQNLIVEGNITNNGIYAGSTIDINSLTMKDVIARNCQVALYLSEKWPETTTVSNLSMDNVTLTNNKFIGAYIGKTVLSGTVANCTVTDNGYSDELPAAWQKTGLQFVNFDEATVPHVVVTNSTFSNNGAGASDIERTGLIIYTAYNALSTSEIMTVSGCNFSNHPLYAVRIKNGYNVGNTATVNGTFTNNFLDIWFNNIIGTTSSTTLVRNTFSGTKTVGAGPTYDYNTIQAAIDATSSGDVINVAAGTYTENLTIDKSLDLLGAGLSTIIDGSLGGGALGSCIDIYASNVLVDGFKIMNGSYGMYIGGGTVTYDYITVSNCEVTGNSKYGIQAIGLNNNNHSYIIFDNVYAHDNDRNGIKIFACKNSEIKNCQITNNGDVSNDDEKNYGIWFGTTSSGPSNLIDLQCFGNSFSDNLNGSIILMDAPGPSVFTGAAIYNNDFSGDVTIGGYGVYNAHATLTLTLDATCNWWGSTDPYDVADATFGNVQFLPFSTAASPTNCDGVGPVVNITQTLSYLTIQAAIDAATAGDEIQVAAGTHDGNITINKSLTILGDPGDAQPGPGTNVAIIDDGSAPGSAFFIANGVTNVTIKGFEMRNLTSSGTGSGNGISAWQAST